MAGGSKGHRATSHSHPEPKLALATVVWSNERSNEGMPLDHSSVATRSRGTERVVGDREDQRGVLLGFAGKARLPRVPRNTARRRCARGDCATIHRLAGRTDGGSPPNRWVAEAAKKV